MQYIESDSHDPYYNLALEQHVFDKLAQGGDFFMLWRNANAIIVGKHQNTVSEINAPYVNHHGIRVVRRLSGGGAVYHDLGNVNFTFIVNNKNLGAFDFASFCRPVVCALAGFGVTAEVNGRNDMTIDGKKFSGNAQYCKRDRIMHHGTILYDSDFSVIGQALVVPKDKIESKGLKSVQSRVTNVKPHMRSDIPVEDFIQQLRSAMFQENDLVAYTLTPDDHAAIAKLRETVYETWAWNYGASPAYTIRKERYVKDCGTVEVFLNVHKGVITDAVFYGDYFANADAGTLADRLKGLRLEREEIAAALEGVDTGEYFHNLDRETLLSIIME